MLLPITWLEEFVDVKESPDLVGQRFYELGFGLESVDNDIIDLEVTPNRGDALSIFGLAREYAASTNQALAVPGTIPVELDSNKNAVEVVIDDEIFNSYGAYVIEGLDNIGKSPDWIVDKLKHMGVSSINPIVDITNLLLFELGQPLHAFDIDKLPQKKLKFTRAKGGETFKAINHKIYKIPPNSIIGVSGGKCVDLVGVQGGAIAEVANSTKKILLQAVEVSSRDIRRTVRSLNLSTEASFRLERNIDRSLQLAALTKAVDLIKKICKGKVTKEINAVQQLPSKKIKIDWKNISNLLGSPISKKIAVSYLKRLNFSVKGSYVYIPPHRYYDINFEEDLIEEIARLYGYNRLKRRRLPTKKAVVLPMEKDWILQQDMAKRMINLGFNEVQTYSFISPKDIPPNFSKSKLVKVGNPLSQEYSYLRPNLLINLVKAAEHNIWYPEIKFFEIGNVFENNKETTKIAVVSNKKLPFKVQGAQKLSSKTARRSYWVWEGSLKDAHFSIPKVSALNLKVETKKRMPSKNAPASRDISFIVSKKESEKYILETIISSHPYILNAVIFDRFRSKKIGEDKKSVAFHVIIDSNGPPLTAGKIENVMEKIKMNLIKKHGAVLR